MYTWFENLIDPLRSQAITRPPINTFAFFWHYIHPVRGVVFATLLLAGIAAVSELYLFVYLGRLLDWMSASANTGGSRSGFLDRHGRDLLWMIIVVAVIRPVSLLGSRALINLAIAPGLANATRWQNHRYVLRQSIVFFQNDFAGRISQKVMQTGHALREAVVNVVDGSWMLLVYLIGIVSFFLEISSVLLWPIAVWAAVYVAVVYFMVPPVRRKSARLSEANSGLIGKIVDSYTNIQSVKLFAHASHEESVVASSIREQTRAFRVMMRAVLGMTVTLTMLNTVLVLATAGVSVWLWMLNEITVGEIAVVNGLVIRLNQVSGWILRTITSLFENIGTVQNGIATIAQPIEVVDSEQATQLQVSKGCIVFDDVTFRYDAEVQNSHSTVVSGSVPASLSGIKASSAVIEHCDFTVYAGEKVGLVGRSGAGKSTLVNLLIRFHDLQHGAIRIDGQNISEVTQLSLRTSIAVVTQDTSLMHRSIRDNIRYGRVGATDEDVIHAATLAEAMDFIPNLYDQNGRRGLDAFVGERGVKLSGGQRQRIAIARVILKDAPILVLDEATSALDSEVEAAIQRQLDTLMQGKTVLAVAHRLSTIAALDRLIVLDGGCVVESGSHAELIARDGLYARLWRRQSGGFIGV
ncbi:MAG: ABC transporter ATP-binding protein [Granulosicoccus sp.]